MSKTIRLLDLILSVIGLVILMPVMSIIGVICFLETGRVFFKQERIGKDQKPFILLKFPSMISDAPSVGTHLIDPSFITKSGRILRKTKLDELPQLFNILKGEMSLIGPRPCLPNQNELINERKKRNIFNFLPGITGLAQLNDIDMANPYLLAIYDERLVKTLNVKNYFLYIILTIFGKGWGDRVRTDT